MVKIVEMKAEEMQVYANVIGVANTNILNLPSEDFIKNLLASSYGDTLEAIAQASEFDAEICQGARLMADYLDAAKERPVEELVVEMGRDRTRLFRGVSTAYAPEYPVEAAWTNIPEKEAGNLVETLVMNYRINGFALGNNAHERADYLGVELEFVRLLFAKGNASEVSVFAENHMQWMKDFVEKALTYAETDFYRGVLLMVRGVVNELTELFV